MKASIRIPWIEIRILRSSFQGNSLCLLSTVNIADEMINEYLECRRKPDDGKNLNFIVERCSLVCFKSPAQNYGISSC